MTGNDKVFAAELLQMFVVQVGNDLRELQDKSAEENWAAVQFTAHRMRSSIAPFGMTETLQALKSLELQLKAGITADAPTYLLAVHQNCSAALAQAEELLETGL